MKREKISEALGNINSLYIEEAEYSEVPHRVFWTKWLSLVACFCFIVVGAFVAFKNGLFDNEIVGNIPNGDIAPGDKNEEGPGADNDEYKNYFSISNSALGLEIYDIYTIDGEADVITVYITECKNISRIFFRSSDRMPNQVIRHIESTDKQQVATKDNNIFIFDFLEGQDFVYLNLYFDEGTFKKSAEINGETNDKVDIDYDPNSPIDDGHVSSTTKAPVTVYFECSAISPEGGYTEISISQVMSAISNEPKVNIFGTTNSLEKAINAVGLQAVLLFEEYTPTSINYSKTNDMTHVKYQYGINAVVTVHIYEYYKIDYTLDDFVYSTEVFDYELYPCVTETNRKDRLSYALHSCYKNDEEYKSEIAVLNYTENGYNIFFVVKFDLYGENIEYNVELLLEQMKLVD